MPTLSVRKFVDEAVESIVNGNMEGIIDDITKLPKVQAICAVAYVVDSLHGLGLSGRYASNLSSFLRRLESRT
jgi:hypothetical protein